VIGIYKIENLINSKVYIGQSRNINKRWTSHRNKPFKENYKTYNSPLYRAIRKYNLDNFKFSILCECMITDLNKNEIHYIKLYKSNNKKFGYNLTLGGYSSNNRKLKNKDIKLIILLLNGTKLSQSDIAKQFDVSQMTISSINSGNLYKRDNIDYPIRKKEYRNKTNIKHYCEICNKELKWHLAIHCPICAKINYKHKVEMPSKDILISEINIYSYEMIGKKYNVSGKTIKNWCNIYNIQRDIKPKIIKIKNDIPPNAKKKIYQYTLNGVFIQEFESSGHALKYVSIDKSKSNTYYCEASTHIKDVAYGRRETAYGYIWKYE